MQFDDAPAAEPKPVKGQTYRKVRAQSHRSATTADSGVARRLGPHAPGPIQLRPFLRNPFLLTTAVMHALDY